MDNIIYRIKGIRGDKIRIESRIKKCKNKKFLGRKNLFSIEINFSSDDK